MRFLFQQQPQQYLAKKPSIFLHIIHYFIFVFFFLLFLEQQKERKMFLLPAKKGTKWADDFFVVFVVSH